MLMMSETHIDRDVTFPLLLIRDYRNECQLNCPTHRGNIYITCFQQVSYRQVKANSSQACQIWFNRGDFTFMVIGFLGEKLSLVDWPGGNYEKMTKMGLTLHKTIISYSLVASNYSLLKMPVSRGPKMLKSTFSEEPRPKKHHWVLGWNASLLSCSGIQAEWTLFELAHALRAASQQNHNHNHIQVGQTGHYKILGVGQSQRGRNSTRSRVGCSRDLLRGESETPVISKLLRPRSEMLPALFGDRGCGALFNRQLSENLSFQNGPKASHLHPNPKSSTVPQMTKTCII